MNWSQFFTSSVGKKITMALSGIFLILFLIIHAGLNACIWANDGGVMFNKAAHFMGANVVPRVLEIGLFLFILLHIIQGLVLEVQNRSKRGIGYAVKMGNRGSAWNSRAMGILGALILIFLVIHISDFWIPSRFGGLEPMFIDNATGQIVPEGTPGAKEYHDLYGEMRHQFTAYPWIIIIYELGVIALFWHLIHGFQSSFRTMGLTNHKYIGLVKGTGVAYSVIICLAFMLMPLSFYFGWIQ
ncbi:succinate dehydrogenase cytochrome b subunit [Niabella drilacis]|uniref:Succinate dehydrogenase / fumarate reductase cytochrome b subunit n=1 Tax=Niabella drilacis (strain DSM 25811 / CCM 8410 / CCUG 62505 / LMG 26954 / E90) TaxID=1285928 RepID=A0A1G6SJY1_NIADE|nr:succinate dehydrogenase cytochrome b subunit [Niabella drilacis]SDD17103.1 succinate dehydrogenase / fumarate reductase cytochrome b subunit [Niabella drilacis]